MNTGIRLARSLFLAAAGLRLPVRSELPTLLPAAAKRLPITLRQASAAASFWFGDPEVGTGIRHRAGCSNSLSRLGQLSVFKLQRHMSRNSVS